MNLATEITPLKSSIGPPQVLQSKKMEHFVAIVEQGLDSGLLRLDEGSVVSRAFSCMLVPEVGDTVVVCRVQSHPEFSGYITSILARKFESAARLSVPKCKELAIEQPEIQLTSTERLGLSSGKDIGITAVTGTIKVGARQLVSTVLGSVIEYARERVSTADFTQITSKFLTHLQSKQAIVTADDDIKVDAERVNIG